MPVHAADRNQPVSNLKDRTAIVGIGETAYARELPFSQMELACMAIVSALEDAGLAPRDVDGLCSFTMERSDTFDALEVDIARSVGLGEISYFSQVGYGGGAACATVGHAAMAVATGQATVAVAWRARKRGGRRRPWAATAERIAGSRQFSQPWGLVRPVDEIAMIARRYMHTYGATREQLANIALSQRAFANRNPRAVMRDRSLTLDEYMAARWVSEPLCLYDNCLETDGACAVVIVPAERASDYRQRPVFIHAYSQALPPQLQTMTNYHCTDPLEGPTWLCGRNLWKRSDLGPDDVSVAQVYDAFSPEVWLTLEGFGFCGRGEGASFTEDGNISIDGALPVNTAGGSLSEAYVHGFNHVIEGVRQMRGTSSAQVARAESCLVTSSEEVPTSAVLLRR